MSVVSAFFASLLAAWPAPVSSDAAAKPAVVEAAGAVDSRTDPMAVWHRLAAGFLAAESAQVRIEQHIIWRVSPMPGPARQTLQAIAPTTPPAPRLVERRIGACLPMASIAGGRPQGPSRLLLLMRDRRLVAANLEKACSARDFYSGFYVDKPNPDGKLCADRDRILARSGARCQIDSFRQLVADD